MLAVQGEALPFGAHYTEGGLNKTGLTVTVDIYRLAHADGTHTQIITNGACTEVGDGLYKYILAGASNNADGVLWAVFYTADADTDAQNIPAIWVVGFANIPALALQASLLSVLSSLQQYSVLKKHIKCDQIEIKRSTDVTIQLYGVGDLTGRTKLYFTVKYMKEKDDATDAQSVIQIEETDGLLYINKTAADTPANGTLTVTDVLAGNITITLAAVESNKLLPNEAYLYDVKMDNTSMTEGRFLISTAITRTLT